ncbi:MAG: hypothetical protein NUV47_02080 [Patescibacteria group bacterium]|nr:hypothetical protein [Patescibacteria group bacterium]
MAYILKKEKAHILRKQGMSINDIANTLQISKSTTSVWCRNILLNDTQVKKLQEKQKSESSKALLKYYEQHKKERIIQTIYYTDIGKKDVKDLSRRDLYITGLALYWAEGYKKGNEEVGFTNSDPEIIKIMIKWFEKIYQIKLENFILRISINNVHSNRIQKIINYWSSITNVPTSQFTKTSLIKTISKKRYLNHDNYYGTLRIKIRRGTNLRRRILGSISQLKSNSFSQAHL